MRFDYPVLALRNTNVINGHKKQVDGVRLILRKVSPHCSLEVLISYRGALSSVDDAGPQPVPTPSSCSWFSPQMPLSSPRRLLLLDRSKWWIFPERAT